MTKTEKIDYIREKIPLYRNSSVLFSKTEKALDQIIAEIEGKKKEDLKEKVERLTQENKELKEKLKLIKEKLCQKI